MFVAGSLLAGLLAAIALVVVPFAGARESAITGSLLLGFAFGWALLALLSGRLTDRPRRWAVAPAVAMGLTGVALLVFAPGSATLTSLGWVWPVLLLALAVWTAVQVRHESSSRTRPWLLYPVFGVLALTAIGGGYETIRNATDGTVGLAAGERLIDVGGHRLAIRCTGSGSPTVVLEAGLGESARAMAKWIAPAVAHTTRICAYDRAGHGLSDPAPGGHADPARDLHVLLASAHIPGPYVIAGHSLGGMFTLSYADRYPAQVAGVVLLDSMHPHQSDAFARVNSLLALLPTVGRTGIPRILVDSRDGAPMEQARQFARDVDGMPGEQGLAAKLVTLGARPLAVITAGKGSASGWGREQDDLAALSGNSAHRTVPGATHQSLIDNEGDAAQSSKAILDVVASVRR